MPLPCSCCWFWHSRRGSPARTRACGCCSSAMPRHSRRPEPAANQKDTRSRCVNASQLVVRPGWRLRGMRQRSRMVSTASVRDEADLLCGPVSDTVAREQHVDFSSPIAIGGIGADVAARRTTLAAAPVAHRRTAGSTEGPPGEARLAAPDCRVARRHRGDLAGRRARQCPGGCGDGDRSLVTTRQPADSSKAMWVPGLASGRCCRNASSWTRASPA